jgi:hypothetical protein
MENHLSVDVVAELLNTDDPSAVWQQVHDLVLSMHPNFDFSLTKVIFADAMQMYKGDFEIYRRIVTPYHNRDHILDVFLCMARLLHGLHVCGKQFSERDITAAMVGTLFHDIGYAQIKSDTIGTGAKYTKQHVQRGIVFMYDYFRVRNFPSELAERVACIMLVTDHRAPIFVIPFPDEATRMMGLAVGTADMVGQMADRDYLEKLLSLYFEFKEGQIGDYQNIHDLLNKTAGFYQIAKKRLDEDLESLYLHLTDHFRVKLGIARNIYTESIQKNMDYLAQVIEGDEPNYLERLKRGGIVKRMKEMFGAELN